MSESSGAKKTPQAAHRAQGTLRQQPFHLRKTFRQEVLAKIARHHPTLYLDAVIKAIDAAQGGPSQEPPSADLAPSAEPVERVEGIAGDEKPQSEVPLLTSEEKRRILARIARVNPLDCFDESGAFDIVRAKRVLPPGAVRQITVHETTRLNAQGQPVTERSIQVRLVDPVSALRLDDQLERRRERAASSSSPHSESEADSPPPHPASPEYAHNLLRKNTIALDEAHHTLALLRKALAEKEDRKHQLSKELDEKDHQLSQTLSKVEGDAAQCDTGCQPVNPKHQNGSPTTTALSPVKAPAPGSVTRLEALSKLENPTPADLKELEALCFQQEAEEVKNTSGPRAFSAWLRARGIDPATYRSPPLGYLPTVKIRMARPSARPPPNP